MSLSRANTVLSIWIILVGLASIGNASNGNAESMTKQDLLDNANQIIELAESTRKGLQNDTKNIESNGTIAEQFGLIAKQADSLVELITPMSLDVHSLDDRFIIQTFYNQLKELRKILGNEYDKFSPEANKQKKLWFMIEDQRDIALDYLNHQNSLSIQYQFHTIYYQLLGVEESLNKSGEPSAIGTVHTMKVLDVVEIELALITKQLKSLTEKYPKQ